MEKPLEGIRVLELSTYVAAPVCGRFLADLGAQVIKVERPAGDDWRSMGVTYNRQFSVDENPIFDLYNSGKECVALNLKSEDGMRVFRQLLDKADVFLTNTRLQSLRRLGISYDQLKEQYPKMVYAMLVGYGENGPDADMAAFDVTAFWARSGFLRDQSMQHEHYFPVVPPSSAGDTVTGMTLLAQINAALLRRERTGKGDLVRSGLFHNGLFTFATPVTCSQKPWGTPYPVRKGAPNIYHCADDEWVLIGMGGAMSKPDQFFEMLGHPELSQDERFNTTAARWKNVAELKTLMAETFETASADHWLSEARRLDISLMRLQHFVEATQDEQAWANGYLERATFRNGEQAIVPTSPLEMDSVGTLTTTSAPLVGDDTAKVLRRLGYTEEEIGKLNESGAVYAR